METIRIATRDSLLAKVQAEKFGRILERLGFKVEYIYKKAVGDRDSAKPLYEVGKVGIFTSELNELLLNNKADFAVHSAKDLPTELEEGLEISLFLEREDYHDFFVSYHKLYGFKGVIGTSSKRRELFLKYFMPTAIFKVIRGNIDTRIRKFQEGQYEAIIVAKAGIDRLGISPPGEIIPENILPPAPNQGIIAVTSIKDSHFSNMAKQMQNPQLLWEAENERKLMKALDMGCHNAIGIKSTFSERITKFSFTDGVRRFDYEIHGEIEKEHIKEISDNLW